MISKTARNPKWTEEELILALDLYMDLPASAISAKNPRVIALSESLNKLKAAHQVDVATYRNANGTALKLHNFARFDPASTSKGMTHGGKLEQVIWERFSSQWSALKERAAAISGSINQ